MQRVSCSSLVSKAVNLSAQPVLAAAASACNSQEVNQSINQFTTHSMNQPINQRRKQSINQAMDQVISSCAEMVLIISSACQQQALTHCLRVKLSWAACRQAAKAILSLRPSAAWRQISTWAALTASW